MEAVVMMHESFDQATSPHPKKHHPIISINYLNFSSGGGLLQPPPFLSQSHSQPPLLPLPTGWSSWKASNRSGSLMAAKKSKSPRKQEKKSTKKVVGIIDSDARKRTDDMMFSGAAVFTISPPPSSLPLPTFLCCNCKAEAAGGVDAGATNDLRRLLRLHARGESE